MARNPKSAGPTPVESINHQDKRTNIPTADAQDFVDPQTQVPVQVHYPRDPSLDPQLVWRGKDAQDSADLVADAPPIYIQEKIDPRVLIENLRDTSTLPADEPEMTLFDDFDGLDELSQIEFYRHQANWSNRMILGDSLQVMSSLAEREDLRGQVQMVYIDPPYGIKFGSNWQVSARKRDVKDGKLEDAAREAEQIKAFRDTWELGINSYLSYLRDRLMAARELLTESGSCFVQIGDENVHLVRSLMDEVFGSENFVSQIVFRTTTGKGSGLLDSTYDNALWYARSIDDVKYRPIYEERNSNDDTNLRFVEESSGTRRSLSKSEMADRRTIAQNSRVFSANPLTSQRPAQGADLRSFQWGEREFYPGAGGTFKTNLSGMTKLSQANRLHAIGNTLRYVRFFDDFPVQPVNNIWDDTRQSGFGDSKIYVVQTAVRTIERCMFMCTDPGDLVLDPTCGSGTTAFVAEQWGRRWITVDTSRVALALARQRLMGAKFPYYLIADTAAGRAKEAVASGKPPISGPATNDIRHGFVYERVQHITLKSIANNPDIKEGMTRAEIDAAIKRHADFEYLYDKPFEDKDKVRVTGPFTVESISPYRSVAFSADVAEANRETISESAGARDVDSATFEQSILENLRQAGIQNGARKERLEFASIDSYAGQYIQAVGETRIVDDVSASRVGLALGPQYGTVGPQFIKDAAREANKAKDIDLVCILAFAFDPQATGVAESDDVSITVSDAGFANVAGERRLGRVPVLLVRMNSDLLMGEDLKKTGAGNLFTVFGEPDIELRDASDGRVVAELRGVDVYNPTTGEIRSKDTGQIALWMIDTEYNSEAFFVRHCYFTGGNDPYKRLKTALKADIDPDAWESLYRTVSRPFPKPESGRIAVKVINDYGDEVMKVFEV